MVENTEKTTHFGEREVPEGEKAGLVHGVFTSVASRYDVMNDFMSLGIHRLWKRYLIDRLSPEPGEKFLDVAGGTGDIAGAFLKRADVVSHREEVSRDASAVVLDVNQNMLNAGQKRKDLQN